MAKKKKKKESKAPSGLKVKRNRNKLTFSWSTHGYEKQEYEIVRDVSSVKNSWPKNPKSIGKGTTSHTITLDASDYYPNSGKHKLVKVGFRVRGCQKDTKKINYTMSDWTTKWYDFDPPPAPTSITVEQLSAASAKFKVEINNHSDTIGGRWATKVQYQTCLIKGKKNSSPTSSQWGSIGTLWTIYNSYTGQNTTSYERTINDTNSIGANEIAVRWIRARVIGPNGKSSWVVSKMAYSKALKSSNTNAYITDQGSSGQKVTVSFNTTNILSNPIDYGVIEYAIASPDSLLQPDNPSWQQAIIGGNNQFDPKDVSVKTKTSYKKKGKKKKKVKTTTVKNKTASITRNFLITEDIGKDKLVYVRVVLYNNNVPTYGVPVIAKNTNNEIPNALTLLSTPSSLDVTELANNLIQVKVTNNSVVEDVFLTVTLNTAEREIIIGVKEEPGVGESTFNVEMPPECMRQEDPVPYSIAVRAVFSLEGPGDPVRQDDGYNIYYPNILFSSESATTGVMPIPPTILSVENLLDGNVRVTWDWSWSEAITAIVGWSDYEYSMESNEEPSSYTVQDTKKSTLVVRNLEAGKTWHFWVRLVGTSYTTAWSIPKSIALSSAPNVPFLDSSRDYISLQKDDSIQLSWTYVSTDTTEQKSATIAQVIDPGDNIVEVFDCNGTQTAFTVGEAVSTVVSVYIDDTLTTEYTRSDSVFTFTNAPANASVVEITYTSANTYYKPLISIPNENQPNSTDQYIMIDNEICSENFDWVSGGSYKLAVKVVSMSQLDSEWSDPITIVTPAPIECMIYATNLDSTQISEDLPFPLLTEFKDSTPLTVTVTGFVNDEDVVALYIERAENYFIDRPDGDKYGGYEGETVCSMTQYGDGSFTIYPQNIFGYLDDSAEYNIVAVIKDQYGQTDSDTLRFEVAYEHQAVMPNALMAIDSEQLLSYIKIIEPESGVEAGDTCDIYRKSVDGYELVYAGAIFGSTYIDPYPTIGPHGGHRVVYKTYNGDYITGPSYTNDFAWIDFDPEDGDLIETPYNIIDFGGERALLLYNVDLNSSWSKDFQKTRYLGGSIQGDWNEGVDRTGTISTAVISADLVDVEVLHELAEYEGECRIRTHDGSNYTANVNVSENMPYAAYYTPDGETTKLVSYTLSVERVDSPTTNLIALGEGDLEGLSIGGWFGADGLRLKDNVDEVLIMPDNYMLTMTIAEGE